MVGSATGAARAGDWVVSYETSSSPTVSEHGLVNKSEPGQEGWAYAYANSYAPYVTPGTITMPPNAKSRAFVTMTVKVSADWVSNPDEPNDRPPDKLYLVETASCSAGVPAHDLYSPTNRPIGVEVLTISNPVVETTRTSDDGRAKYSDGPPKITQYDNPERKTHFDLVTRTFTAEAVAIIPPVDHSDRDGQFIASGAGVNVGYSAYVYSKGVFLSREGAHHETIDADGNWHGDTIYSRRSSGSDAFWTSDGLNWQLFNAIRTGTWDYSKTTWTWQPAYSEANFYSNQWAMVHGGTYWYNGMLKGTPADSVSGTMTYTASDASDGGSATAKYFLKVHEPFKTKGTPISSRVIKNEHEVVGWATASYDGQPITLTYEIGYGWTVGISFGGNLKASEAAGLELGFDASYSRTYSGSRSLSITLNRGFRVRLMAGDYFKVYSGTSEAYDTGGSVGDVDWEVDVPDGDTVFLSPPEYVGDPNGGGQGGDGGIGRAPR